MIREITIYAAEDGSRFDTRDDAERHELFLDIKKYTEAPLGPRAKDSGTNFSNGGGYIQHTAGAIAEARARHDVLQADWPSKNTRQFRLECIDRSFREWGQPYFAHFGAGKGAMTEWTERES